MPTVYYQTPASRMTRIETAPPALPVTGRRGGGNLAKLAFGQGAASALSFLATMQYGGDDDVKLLRSAQCKVICARHYASARKHERGRDSTSASTCAWLFTSVMLLCRWHYSTWAALASTLCWNTFHKDCTTAPMPI